MEKPPIYVDFAKGHLSEVLPTLAFQALEAHGLPVQAMLQDLRNFGKQKRLANQRAAPLMRITSKYVQVRPTNLRDMFTELGPREAQRYILGEQPPKSIWDLLYSLRQKDKGLADLLWSDLLTAMDREGDRTTYAMLVLRYRRVAAARDLGSQTTRAPAEALSR